LRPFEDSKLLAQDGILDKHILVTASHVADSTDSERNSRWFSPLFDCIVDVVEQTLASIPD